MIHFLLEKIAYLLRNRELHIDREIPSTYLLLLGLSKTLSLINGFIMLRKPVFVGSGVVIKARRKIFFGQGLIIERGCFIDALSESGIILGSGVSLNKNVTIECSGSLSNLGVGLRVGSNVGIGSGSFLGCAGGVVIGDDTIIGNMVSFHSENHNYSDPSIPIRNQGVSRKGIIIGSNCWIGAKVTILDGAIVGDGCVVAAGAVLKAGNYERNAIYAGVPAKLIRTRIEGGDRA